MSFTNKYIQQARNASGNAYNNATGGYKNATGELAGRFGSTNSFASATGASQQNNMIPTSAPYILTVSNASNAAITNFDIFGANYYLNGGFGTFSSGSWTYQNVTVSSGIGNVTYTQLLQQVMNKPISIGQTQLFSESGSVNVINRPVTYNTTFADGSSASQVLTFVYNNFQNITTQTTNYVGYVIDGAAKLTFSSIPANTSFNIYLYPTAMLDITASLAGGSVAQSFQNPRTNQQTVLLK